MDTRTEHDVDQERRCAQGRHAELIHGQCPACLSYDLED